MFKLAGWVAERAEPPPDFHYCTENLECAPYAIKVTLCLNPQLVRAFAEWDKTQPTDHEPVSLTELVEDAMYQWLKHVGINPYGK
jgi:hypothetical protein